MLKIDYHSSIYMKNFFRKTIAGYLRALSKIKLAQSNKTIIGITGSIGKTTTKAATVKILKSKFTVDESSGNYNTDFGLMLSILKQKSGNNSPIKWLKSIFSATTQTFLKKDNIQKLVLEMGVDKPGDMTDILKIVHPQISIITSIAPVHLAKGQFKDEEDILNEKAKLIRTMKKGHAILNHDSPLLQKLAQENLNCKTLFFGTIKENQNISSLPPGLYASNIKETINGLTATLTQTPTNQTEKLKSSILGPQHIYSLLPAIITGLLNKLSLKEACQELENFQLPPGRLNTIKGINNSTIIDSSYNASPETVKAALKTLWNLPSQRKIAVLGNMNELGKFSAQAHKTIGQIVPKQAQYLITIGDQAKLIAQEAATHGMPKHLIKAFNTAEEAGHHLKNIIRHDDLILVKGSQNNVFLERVIKIIMKEPEKAKDLLVRQY